MASPALAKQLPCNLNVEREILGAVILDNAALGRIAGEINTLDFFLDQHRRIFRCMLKLGQSGSPIDLPILANALHKSGELEEAGGGSYLASLADGMPRVSNVEHYCLIVKEASVRRQTIKIANRIQERAWEGEETPGALIALAQQQLAGIKPTAQTIVGGNGKLSYSVDEFLAQKFPAPEHAIEWIFSRSGSALIVAKPHHLKSWWCIALGLLATVSGQVLGKLNAPRPVRTLLVSVEDFPGQTQERMDLLLRRDAFRHVDRPLFRIVPRPVGGLDIMDEAWYQRIIKEALDHQADLIIFDVLRRIFKGDINSPKESSLFCEQMERIRDTTNANTAVVHHENRKEADIMAASAGSFNLPGWANSVVRFQRKLEEIINDCKVTSVEIEVDNKFAPNPEPVRMVLDLAAENPIRLETLEDATGLSELRKDLATTWTVNDLAEVLGVHKSNAKRRLRKLDAAGLVEKVADGKRGRTGGLARYQFVGAEA